MGNQSFKMAKKRALDLSAEVTGWQRDHDEAMACLDLEAVVGMALVVIKLTVKSEEKWSLGVLHGTYAKSKDPEVQELFSEVLKLWLGSARELKEADSSFCDYDVEGLDELEAWQERVTWMMADPADIFDREEFVRGRDEALDSAS